MAETLPDGDREKRRERPTHWSHPVNEKRRVGRVRRYRRRQVVLAILALLVVGLTVAYFHYTSDKQVEQFAESYLEKLLGTRVVIGRASFTPSEGLVLENLAVVPPKPFTEELLVAQRVDLRIDPWSLLRLAPQVTEIVVRKPRINLVLWNKQTWNFQALKRTQPLSALGPKQRPVVRLEEGWLRIESRTENEVPYTHQMKVSGLLLPSENNPDSFRFQTDVTSPSVHLAVASGLMDARTGAFQFEGQASNVALSPDLYQTLPPEARRIWDRFEPEGSVNIKLLFDEKRGFRLETEMTGVRFAYPYKGVVYQFENLMGRCDFSPTAVGLAGVQGTLNGMPIRIEGDVTGFDRERLALDLGVWAEHVDFGDCKAMFTSLAPQLESIYIWYSPRGQIGAAMRVFRTTDPKDPLEVSGTVFCRDVEMTYLTFPYRVEHLRGEVAFDPIGYVVDGLEGMHGQAKIRVAGMAMNPGPRVEACVLVSGVDVPLDEDLRSALTQAQRDAYDQYSPQGLANISVEVYREPVAGAKPLVSVQLELKGCDLTYKNFPYKVTGATGHILIVPQFTRIERVEGRHGPARISLAGEMYYPEKAPPQITLNVKGTDVSLDDDLAAALPQRERDILAVFHLSGAADIAGTVIQSPATKNKLDYDLSVHLKGARMIYEPFPFLAEQVTGNLRLAGGSCRIESLSGFNAGARIDAHGWIDQRQKDYAMDLVLSGQDVILGESLRGALGPEMRTAWSHLAPQGRVDILAHLTKALGSKEPVKHHVIVTARDAQVRLDVFPYPLEHLTGQMEFQGGEVRLHELKARTGSTEFTLGGRITYGELGPDLDLTLQTKGLRLEGPLRDALPDPLKRAFAVVVPTGRLDLNIERLVYQKKSPDLAVAEWTGSAVLDEVGMEPGIKVTGVVGTAEMQGKWENGRVALQGEMKIQQGKVADKEVSDVRIRIEKAADSSVVNLRQIEGNFYDGRLEGSATLGLGPNGKYAFNLAAMEVNLERLLRDGFRIEHNITGGKFRGTLGFWATGPDTKTLEASGYAYIDDAKLYELPIFVRLLNAFRLDPNDHTAFQKARILYFVRGQRLILGDIRLEGRAMNLYGAGTLETDGKINFLFLTGKHNDDPLLPAIEELLEGVRKELLVVLVTGTLGDPKVETRSLTGLGAPFRELIQLVKERRANEGRPTSKKKS